MDLVSIHPSILQDIRYATANNFLGYPIYTKATCYLHKDAAAALYHVQLELQKQGLGLKIWDGYRPLHVQQLMWDAIQDERYISNPAKNKGRHTRGTAVDVTLVDEQGKELDMPSLFDEFTEKAHSDFAGASPSALHHRHILTAAMKKHGFEQYTFEWWHFDLVGWQDNEKYPALDVPL